ncbi:aspartate dehydrogenase [Mesorhizobium sp. INR15]|uniref:aspartate dehydrogenase n=1 Tax=Mesorhizobium sp. INR15 TaxID=2654248 RepID=UPI00189693ED|nr:aspartate dehydrogenase [Mesorhizobium sp. INR15]
MKIVLIGFGAINRHVVDVLSRTAPEVQIAAIGLPPGHELVGGVPGARLVTEPEALREIRPDMVVEAASREAVSAWGEAALMYCPTFIVSSASALADDIFSDRMHRLAIANGSRLIVSSGAVAGIDALAAVSLAGVDMLHHEIIKPPAAWQGTPADALLDGVFTAPVSFFSGTARQAGMAFPANANVAVITAKGSGAGLDAARVELVADPSATENRHRITAAGVFGTIRVEVDNKPLKANPKSSQLAALALARLVLLQMPGVRF